LVAICSQCGTTSEGAKFCPECGAQFAAGPHADRRERRVVSVLFADLVGFTSHSEGLDVEDVEGFLSRYHQLLRGELQRHGGTVEKFIGDAVMALFGAPVAYEDDAERAVRSALSIQDAVAEMRERDGVDLRVRVGVTTGEALVALGADPGAGEGMASGDVVNTAARLQSAAPVDGVLVDAYTHRATERVIRYAEVDAVVAKGKAELVEAWRAVEPRSIVPEQARVGGLALVGRDGEADMLRGALDRSRREPSTQLVSIIGEPGIGKTRLVEELGSYVEQLPGLITWRRGRSLSYGEGVAFWALGEMVKSQAGVLESDSAEAAETKLAEAVRAVLLEGQDRGWVERHLRPLVGLEAQGAAGGEGGRVEAFAAWRRGPAHGRRAGPRLPTGTADGCHGGAGSFYGSVFRMCPDVRSAPCG
jgi:class 3 adenylate cyclase